MPVRIRIVYPRFLRERAQRVSSVFKGDGIVVELVEDNSQDTIVYIGSMFATTDLTKATALLRREMLIEGR